MGIFKLWASSPKEADETAQTSYPNSITDGGKKTIVTETVQYASSDDTDDSQKKGEKLSDNYAAELDAADSAHNHLFQNPEVRDYWYAKYDESHYENKQFVDPELTWTKKEERRVVLKSDFHALLWAVVMFVALDIDRSNLANAVGSGLLTDLHLTTNDYNLGNTLNLVCFLAAELPSQLVSKAVGPDRFLPTQVVVWSICAICQCRMNSKASFLVLRCLVGFCEGGFIPEQLIWLSYFYTNSEYIVRSAFFYLANPLTSAFSSLLSAAIQTLDGKGGWAGWQYIFLIEGLITLVVGLISYKMPQSVSKTKTWFRPRGWYTDREVKIMVNRVLRDEPSKGTMNNRQAINFKMLWESLTDYDMWPIFFARFLMDAGAQPISSYMPILLRSMGYKSVTVNLLMAPYMVAKIFTLLGQAFLARRFKQSGYALFFTPFWVVPPIIAMRWWKGFLHDHWASYALLFVTLAGPPSYAMTSSWSGENSNSVARRTVSAALVNMFSQGGGIAGNNVFQKSDAPRYPKGLEAALGLSLAGAAAVLVARFLYAYHNRSRERKWRAMSVEEQVEYIKTTKDEGNKRLDFRFRV